MYFIRHGHSTIIVTILVSFPAAASLLGDTINVSLATNPFVVGGFENTSAIVSNSEIEFEGAIFSPHSGLGWSIYADFYRNTLTIGFSDPEFNGQPHPSSFGHATNVPYEFSFTDLQWMPEREIQEIRLVDSSSVLTQPFMGYDGSTWDEHPLTWDIYTTPDTIHIGGIEGFVLGEDGLFVTFQIVVPEPTTWTLLVIGLVALACRSAVTTTK